MLNHILVPLDGSAIAEKALPYARALGKTLKVPITLITAVEPAADFFSKMTAEFDALAKKGIRNREEYLDDISRSFSGAAIRYRVEKGRAEDVIIENAATETGTLITMATHGRSGLGRWLIGSTVEKVVRAATDPVLVVRATQGAGSEGEAALKSIIVPLDGSTLAESALSYVVELAKAFHARVTLLRSYSLKQIIFRPEEFHPDLDELKGGLRWEAAAYLDKKVAELKSRGLFDVLCSVSEGDAAEAIIEMGKETPNTLIVMSAHSGSKVKHWVLGSVTEKVLRHATNSVLTIRT